MQGQPSAGGLTSWVFICFTEKELLFAFGACTVVIFSRWFVAYCTFTSGCVDCSCIINWRAWLISWCCYHYLGRMTMTKLVYLTPSCWAEGASSKYEIEIQNFISAAISLADFTETFQSWRAAMDRLFQDRTPHWLRQYQQWYEWAFKSHRQVNAFYSWMRSICFIYMLLTWPTMAHLNPQQVLFSSHPCDAFMLRHVKLQLWYMSI